MPSAMAAGQNDASPGVTLYLTLGRFEQDNKTKNGPEPLEWQVLEIRGSKALVISKYGLLTAYYGSSYVWKDSEIRSWLNGTFLNSAFTPEELGGIEETLVDNSEAQNYSGYPVGGSADTVDRIFLLSYREAAEYFSVKNEREKNTPENLAARAAPTEYARAKDRKSEAVSSRFSTARHETAGKWWLRSPGARENCAIYITPEGTVGYNYTATWRNLVRPAMWINLEYFGISGITVQTNDESK